MNPNNIFSRCKAAIDNMLQTILTGALIIFVYFIVRIAIDMRQQELIIFISAWAALIVLNGLTGFLFGKSKRD